MEATDTKNLVEHLKSFFTSEEKPAEEPTISRDEFVELCGKVDSLADTLKQALDLLTKEETVEAEAVVPEVEEPVEQVEAEATEEAPVEEPKKEEVEMLAHTDAEEEIINFSAPKFDYKLSTSERIAKAMKQF